MDIELNEDNIFLDEDIDDLFGPDDEDTTTEDGNKDNKNPEDTIDGDEEIDNDDLFEDTQESVDSEDTTSTEDSSVKNTEFSPTTYSSIATAFKTDGIFSELGDDDIAKIKTAEDFAEAVEAQLQAKLDAKQKRINDALNVGLEPSEIKKYETTINYLESLSEDTISAETEDGDNLRKNLIYQDYINKGLSHERAIKQVNKSFTAGTDIEDALEALDGNKDFYIESYNKIIDEERDNIKKAEEDRVAQTEKITKSIMTDKELFGGLDLDKNVRQKVVDNISKPFYKDPKTGTNYTAIQKYEMDNKEEFLKNLGIIFTVTNGFKDLDKLVQTKVNKQSKKGIRELENTLNNSKRDKGGNLNFVTKVTADPDSVFGKGFIGLDV